MTNRMQGMNALVVDDESMMRMSVAGRLRKFGFARVDESESVPEALDRLAGEVDYDVIVSDWNMDPITGLELLKAVRADRRFGTVVFVLMTAEPSDEKKREANEAGVSGFLVKPFTGEALEATVSALLDERKGG